MVVKIKEVVKYDGHSVRANGSVDLGFKAMYSELTNSMQVLQMLNNDVNIIAKFPSSKPIKLGMFRVKNVVFDGDGESKLKFNAITDNVEMDALNSIISNEEFQILMQAEIEIEDNESEDNDE